MYEYAKAHRIPAAVSHSAVFTDCIDSIFFYDASVLVAVDDGCGRERSFKPKKINAARFTDAETMSAEREFLRGILKLEEDAVRRGTEQMRLAKKHHDILEKIYGAAADFDGINEMFSGVRGEIFGQIDGNSDS